uniref:Movement protein n=1 Tax=Rubber tree latent virus 2 TaxID=3079710 RepID=A0AA96T446_9VIRU|nr:movement protein [Rubber tree latent virus 2]
MADTPDSLVQEEEETAESLSLKERMNAIDSFKMQGKDLGSIFKEYKALSNFFIPRVKIFEQTHPLSFTDQVVDISLLEGLLTDIPKGLNFIHVGAIQIGLIPLFSFKKNIAACVALMDARFEEDFNAISGMVGARLNSGPVWINHHPGYCLSLKDKHIRSALKLKIKLNGLGKFKRGAEFLSICVRLYVKYSNSSASKVVYSDDELILSSFSTTADGTIHENESECKDLLMDPDFWNLSTVSGNKIVKQNLRTNQLVSRPGSSSGSYIQSKSFA